MIIFGTVITAVIVKAAIIKILAIIGTAAITGIGIRGGWYCATWFVGAFQDLILKHIKKDPDLLMEKVYLNQGTPSFNESAYIMHEVRKRKNVPGPFEEITIKPSQNAKSITLDLPLDRIKWKFDLDLKLDDGETETIKMELYMKYLQVSKKICIWASKKQCSNIKSALKQHNEQKRK